jgi:hypothetical protein
LNIDTVAKFKLYKNMRAEGEALAKELDGVRSGTGTIHRFIPMATSTFVRDHEKIRENPRSVPVELRNQLGRWIESTVDKGYVWLAHKNALCKSISNYCLSKLNKTSEDILGLYVLDIIAAYFGSKNHRKMPDVSMQIEGLEVYWTGDRFGDEKRVYRGFPGVVVGEFVRMSAVSKEAKECSVDLRLTDVESKIMPWMVKTVHKSQGQSLANVVYLIKTVMGGKHNLELAYTAQSRARKDAIVISLCHENKNPRLVAENDRETSVGGAK